MIRQIGHTALVAAFMISAGACTEQRQSRPVSSPLSAAVRATTAEQPLPAESNPPGDIPDTQAFVTYRAPSGYSVDAPEGWARSQRGSIVSFVNHFDGMAIAVTSRDDRGAIAAVQASALAGRGYKIEPVRLPGGPAVLISFTSNSTKDPLTGKRVRLENEDVVYERAGKTATLSLWAPLGADNVDQWKRIESSFRWR